MGDDSDRRHDERREDDRRIWIALDDLRTTLTRIDERQVAAGKTLDEVRADVKHINANGCALASTHAAHDRRIGALESRAGTLAVAGGGGGLIGAAMACAGQWVWQRIAGGGQ